MRDILFWGATGQAKVLHDIVCDTDMRLVVLVDNRTISSPIPGVLLLRGETGLDAWLTERGGTDNLYGAVAIGGGHGTDRIQLLGLLKSRGIDPVTLIHRTAFVAHSAVIGEGSQILAQSSVCANAQLGRGVIINTAASVDHDGVIGNGVHIGPGARLAGEVIVGNNSFIGTGAVILPRIQIGNESVIGAGAVVIKNVKSGTTVVGNPARVLGK
ncbi:MAG: NeuD/PglB/VioB family sugar acetyltransferase [Trichlorobacter sp.]|uniref:NeuD/PglB/VioB family sugar acetyltransferase n=1 Tax=Trichlorobacter sp. TaxID=2911007 RepID=UPI00256CD465|nr:NeuD/PglB/VioB family sugar acetyltransferase [Trichlorobacter sp.]MDK9719214.1 NeuD/PglB/VioB family sugar acetyltransferase [Trichlorobacter sp.]